MACEPAGYRFQSSLFMEANLLGPFDRLDI